jgi:hypothetical protein
VVAEEFAVTRRTIVATTWLAVLAGALALAYAALSSGGIFDASFALVLPPLGADAVAFASVGAILSLRRPGNRVGLVLLVAGALIVLTFLGFVYGALLTVARGQDDVLAGFTALFGVLGIYPTLIVAGPMLALVLPDGHLPGARWRWAVRAIAVLVAVSSTSVLVRPGPLGGSFANNPVGVPGVAWLDALSRLGEGLASIAVPSALLLGLAGVVVRFRRARSVERQQLKWFVAANVAVVVFLSLSIADGATQPTVFDVLAVWSLSLPPIAVGIAILRYHLYEIDRLISRTVSWAVVTGVLATVFVTGVIALQAALARFTEGQTVAVAASTLVALALFQPLRRRVQSAVDRRFDRTRYDARHTVDAFAERLRNEVDLARLRTALGATAGDAVRPVSAVVWLRAGSDGGR